MLARQVSFFNRREFLAAGAVALGARGAQRPLNVLFLAVDDLRPSLGCYGDRVVRTPNIDRLASRGLVFTRAYCQQAVCSPSRTSLLTGRRPDTTRIYELNTHFRKHLPDVVTLPEHFKNHGYVTSGIGKIFHNGPIEPGLDDARSWSIPGWYPGMPRWGSAENAEVSSKHAAMLRDAGWYLESRARPPGAKRGPSWSAPDVADTELADGKIADTGIEALRQLKDKPFFLGVGFFKPHLPFVAPKKYFDLYKDHKFKVPENRSLPKDAPSFVGHTNGEVRAWDDVPKEGPIPDEKALEFIRAYHAATSYSDAQIGRVVAELDRLGLRQNTAIVLWGDHGYHLGDHGLWHKHTNFETATRAPLIVSVPGQRNQGRKTAALTEFVDIYPSLCGICGLPAPEGLEGSSFAHLLDDPERPWKRAAFSQFRKQVPGVGRSMGYSMRTDRYRYTEWVVPEKDFKALELYDHKKDPAENVNVALRPENEALISELAAMMQAGWRGARPQR